MSAIKNLLNTAVEYGCDDFEEGVTYIKEDDVKDFADEIEVLIQCIREYNSQTQYSKDDIESELYDLFKEVSW